MISPPHCTHSFSDSLLTKRFLYSSSTRRYFCSLDSSPVWLSDGRGSPRGHLHRGLLSIRTLPSPLTESPYCALVLESRNGGARHRVRGCDCKRLSYLAPILNRSA